MKKFLICFTACLAIMGCATEGQYRSQLATMAGQSKEALLAKWGNPTGQYTDENGDDVIAYIRNRDIMVAGTPTYAFAGGGFSGSFGNGVMYSSPNVRSTSNGLSSGGVHLSCMTKFIIKNGIVSSSTFKGNDCKARNW